MLTHRTRTLALSLAVLALSFSGHAWDVSGHMIIAQIAYERLNDHAKAQLKELASQLELNTQPLNEVNVAAWADVIKHQRGGTYGGHYKNWHFIDIGCKQTDPNPLAKPPALSIQNGDVVSALNRCVAVIQDGEPDPLIPSTAVALALITHLVGDLHQPLHCTAYYYAQAKVEPGHVRRESNDGGGNAITLSNFHDQYPELHQFWDIAYKTDFSDGVITSEKDLVVAEVAPNSAQVNAWAEKVKAYAPSNWKPAPHDFHAWAVETHALGCSAGYDALDSDPELTPKALSAAYAAAAKQLACKQMCIAGYRLADLLNELYP